MPRDFDVKAWATSATKKALRDGWSPSVNMNACTICGSRNPDDNDGRVAVHQHHADYTNPLFIIPLCGSCHKKVHNGSLDEPITGRNYRDTPIIEGEGEYRGRAVTLSRGRDGSISRTDKKPDGTESTQTLHVRSGTLDDWKPRSQSSNLSLPNHPNILGNPSTILCGSGARGSRFRPSACPVMKRVTLLVDVEWGYDIRSRCLDGARNIYIGTIVRSGRSNARRRPAARKVAVLAANKDGAS